MGHSGAVGFGYFMAFLEKFSAEERTLLVRLPYRAGLWISQSDETGNPGAAHDEAQALEAIIARQARGMFHSAFAHEIMAEMWEGRADWHTWDENMDQLLVQSAEAARIVNMKLTRHDLDAYRATIMYIATEVAKAFSEAGAHPSVLSSVGVSLRLWKGRLGSAFRNEPYDPVALLNISPVEDEALAKLAEALSAGAEHAVDPQT
jgi:hypothetical protein